MKALIFKVFIDGNLNEIILTFQPGAVSNIFPPVDFQ